MQMNKTLGSIHLWGIAVGLVISGDYFGWNFGWQFATVWEFAFTVSMVAIFYTSFSFSFTELATSIPHAGGPSAYAHHAFGSWGGLLAGYFTLIEFVLAPPAIASALGGYFHYLFPEVPPFLASIVFFVLLLAINLLGVKQTAKFELFVTMIAVSGLLIYIFSLTSSFDFNRLNANTTWNWKNVFLALPYGIWFFLAVEGVAMSAEEVKNPKKDIPIGYSAGIVTLILLAYSILFITAGNIETNIASKLEYPLSFVLGNQFGATSLLVQVFTFIGLFGLIASLLGIILGFSRQIYALAREGFLPKFLGILNRKTSVPSNAVLFGGFIGILAMILGNTDQLIALSAMGACGMYVISMFSFFQLRIKQPRLLRPFRVKWYPYFPAVSAFLAILFFISISVLYVSEFLVIVSGLVILAIFFHFSAKKNIPRFPKNQLSSELLEGLYSRGDTDF